MCTEGCFKRIAHEESCGKQYPAGIVAWEVRNFRVLCVFVAAFFFSFITLLLLRSHLLKSLRNRNIKKVFPVNKLR